MQKSILLRTLTRCLGILIAAAPSSALAQTLLLDPLDIVWSDPTAIDPQVEAVLLDRHPGWTLAATITADLGPAYNDADVALFLDRPPVIGTADNTHTAMITIIAGDIIRDHPLDFPATGIGPAYSGVEGEQTALVLYHWQMRQGIETYDLAVLELEDGQMQELHRLEQALTSTCAEDGSGRIDGYTYEITQNGDVTSSAFVAPCSPP